MSISASNKIERCLAGKLDEHIETALYQFCDDFGLRQIAKTSASVHH
jgi:hypothetical protein